MFELKTLKKIQKNSKNEELVFTENTKHAYVHTLVIIYTCIKKQDKSNLSVLLEFYRFDCSTTQLSVI